MARGYMDSRIFLTAVELGVFDRIGRGSATARGLAGSLGSDPEATEILLDALAGLGLLRKTGEDYAVEDGPVESLVPGSRGYQGGAFRHLANLWKPWSRLTEVVRKGRLPQPRWTEDQRRDLAMEMERLATGKAERLASLLGSHKVRKLLDLGGGPGSYAIAFARKFPSLRAVIIDRDDRALEVANERILGSNLQGRVETRKGDFFLDSPGEGFDLVILSSVVCLLGSEEILFVLRRVRETLEADGRIAILDIMLEDSRTHPPDAAIFAVNMLLTTESGRCVTVSGIKGWLEEAGFVDAHRLPAGHSCLVIGKKPPL